MEQVAGALLLTLSPGAKMAAMQTRSICHLTMTSMALHGPKVQWDNRHYYLWLGTETFPR